MSFAFQRFYDLLLCSSTAEVPCLVAHKNDVHTKIRAVALGSFGQDIVVLRAKERLR